MIQEAKEIVRIQKFDLLSPCLMWQNILYLIDQCRTVLFLVTRAFANHRSELTTIKDYDQEISYFDTYRA
jgi:hypothetical protein